MNEREMTGIGARARKSGTAAKRGVGIRLHLGSARRAFIGDVGETKWPDDPDAGLTVITRRHRSGLSVSLK